jgi:hypothetical protein
LRPTSLKETVDRILGGQNWVDAVGEFLDEFYLAGATERQSMIGEEPGLTGAAFQDAYIGAVGEHLARRWGLELPAWADDPRRFLDEPRFQRFDHDELTKTSILVKKFGGQSLTLADAHGLAIINERRIPTCWSTDRHLGLTGALLIISSAGL